MRKHLTLFIAIIALNSITFSAIAATTASPAESLNQMLSSIHTLQAHFVQQSPDRAEGYFLLKKPGKFFWRTLNPIHQDIISDGKQLWIYDKDLEQILVKSLKANVGVTPVMLLNGQQGSIDQNYRVRLSSDKPDFIQIYTLIPKKKTLYQAIQMKFKKGILTQMRCEDNLDQSMLWTFTDVKVNQPIEDKLFIFNPPADVDVLNE